jgi:hypothetical protein
MYAIIQSIPMEADEASPRLRLQDKLQHKVRWLGILWRAMAEQGSDGVNNGRGRNNGASSEHHDDEDDGFEMLEPTYAFGNVGPIEYVPLVPSQAEADARPIVDEALSIDDPWENEENLPPLSAGDTVP